MAYPHIKPVSIGRDGWSALYATEADRLLYHCGLRPAAMKYCGVRRRTVISWKLSADAARVAANWYQAERK
jgi:hypothetical protein